MKVRASAGFAATQPDKLFHKTAALPGWPVPKNHRCTKAVQSDLVCLFVFVFSNFLCNNSKSHEWILMKFPGDVDDIPKNSACLLMFQILEGLWPFFVQGFLDILSY